jgi:two-component system sensor histidine kinase DesK
MPTPDPIAQQRQQKWAWIWLAYTGFLFIQPLIEPTRNLWLGTLISFATFLSIFYFYVRNSDEGNPTRFLWIGATFLLGLASFPWNQGASTYFVYTAAFLPFAIASVRRVLWLMLLECVLIAAEGYAFSFSARHGAFHIGLPNTLIAIFLVVVIGGGNIFFAEQRRADCKLRAAQEENVALAAVAERERIARDLHDVLGHTLSVIVLKAELAKRLIGSDPNRAAAEIADVESTARTALSEVREAIGGYRARGLAAEIEAARRILDSAGVTLIVEEDESSGGPAMGTEEGGPFMRLYRMSGEQGPGQPLNPQEETVLALALREAVTNIVRHARATTCTLRFVTEHGHRRLIVADNGQHPLAREGNGLRGMRERVESIGGKLLLERGVTAEATGTRLLITLPLHTEAA